MTQEQFDTSRFLALLEHFDNSNAGESGNAIRRALKQCSDANLSFVDALRLTFKTDDDLEREYGEKMDAAAETITTQASTIKNHEREIGQLREQLRQVKNAPASKPGPAPIDWTGFFRFRLPSIAWTWPTILTLALGLVSAVTWLPYFGGLMPMLLRLAVFIPWVIVVLRSEGPRVFAVKLAVWVVGWYITAATFFLLFPLGYGYTRNVLRWLVIPWNGLSPVPYNTEAILLSLVFMAAMVAANLSPLGHWLTGEERGA